MIRAWLRAFVVAILYLATGWALVGTTGLSRTVVVTSSPAVVVDARRVDRIDVGQIDTAPGVTVTWTGAWEVPVSGLYELSLGSRGRSSWTIDGRLALATDSADGAPTTRTVWLAAGFRDLRLDYAADPSTPSLQVAAAPLGRALASLEVRSLKPRPPRNPRLRAAARLAQLAMGWLAVAALVWAIRETVRATRRRWPLRISRPTLGRTLAWAALSTIIAHGALLRLDAISGRYGPVISPEWLGDLQTRSVLRPAAIRPDGMDWRPEPLYPHQDGIATRYRSDPYIYLEAAREMTSFYAAHFREPVFPFATKVALWLLDDQDVAVSFASTGFSLLAIWLTYVLGSMVWSRPAGLLAALGFSLNHDVIALASLGWRDDAYAAAVVLCACLMVRCWRVATAPGTVRRAGPWRVDAPSVEAVLLGVACGLAVLTRVMAVAFLAAGALWFLLAVRASWRGRLTVVGLATGAALIVAAPYFVNCWRVYGDPLFTFNVHGGIYSVAEGQAEWKDSTAAYVSQKFEQRPFQMIDTVAQGLTTYPFNNKWSGLDSWVPGIAAWAPVAALAGLVLLAGLAPGRLLLVAAAASLLPFAFTWKADANFRFTVHAYPFLLVAAAAAVSAAGRLARVILVPRREAADAAAGAPSTPSFSSWPAWAGLVALGVAALWFVGRVSPAWTVAEQLRAREDATIAVGSRDGAFFGRGWSETIGGGNVRLRATMTEAEVLLPLPGPGDYSVTLRLDPFPRPLPGGPARLPVVATSLNDIPLGVIAVNWSPDRVGAHDLVLPREATRRGTNRLVLTVQRSGADRAGSLPGLSDGDGVGLWHVRVRPTPGG